VLLRVAGRSQLFFDDDFFAIGFNEHMAASAAATAIGSGRCPLCRVE
jgi:hypothetical protein